MWRITPSFNLPEPYQLHEDSTGLYLINDSEIIGLFTHRATPDTILAAINEHKNGVAV